MVSLGITMKIFFFSDYIYFPKITECTFKLQKNPKHLHLPTLPTGI